MAKVSLKAKHPSSETRAHPPSPIRPGKAAKITAEQRRCMIEEAAYYLAESRGFQNGDPSQDWLRAETEIDRKLKGALH